MLHKLVLASAFAVLLSSAGMARASDYGTAEEARALLDRAVVLLQAEGRDAIPELDSDAFRDRDLYIFCNNVSDAVSVVHPLVKGTRITDNDFGKEIMANAAEGEVKEIVYEWPRPGSEVPVKKFVYYTRVGDLVCGSGSYAQP